MNKRFVLAVAVFAATGAQAQQRIGTPALEISREVQRADQQVRDINDLKQQMAAHKQVLENQQEQIIQLRACVRQLDAELAGSRILGQAGDKPGELAKTMTAAGGCRL